MKQAVYFHPTLRVLHWLMAAAILMMLFIGVAMVSTVSSAHSLLVSIHKPLGVMILLLVIVRLWLRFTTAKPALPASIPAWQRGMAHLSHWMLYLMMVAQPLIGWAMLSAAGYPVTLARDAEQASALMREHYLGCPGVIRDDNASPCRCAASRFRTA